MKTHTTKIASFSGLAMLVVLALPAFPSHAFATSYICPPTICPPNGQHWVPPSTIILPIKGPPGNPPATTTIPVPPIKGPGNPFPATTTPPFMCPPDAMCVKPSFPFPPSTTTPPMVFPHDKSMDSSSSPDNSKAGDIAAIQQLITLLEKQLQALLGN